MDKVGRILLLVLLLAIAVLGIWLLLEAVNFVRQTARGEGPPLIDVEPLLPNPTPKLYPSTATVIESVQRLGRLETVSYRMEKVITAESGQGPLGFLFGDKLLLIAHGEIIAGVDLSKIGPSEIQRTDAGTVYVKLPAVEVFVATLDNNRTYVYDRRTGVAGLNVSLETAARQEAERLILQDALETGLLEEAEEGAHEVLRSFILGLGFEHVIFVEVLPTPIPEPTETMTVTVMP